MFCIILIKEKITLNLANRYFKREIYMNRLISLKHFNNQSFIQINYDFE